jgi:hypothetical protein
MVAGIRRASTTCCGTQWSLRSKRRKRDKIQRENSLHALNATRDQPPYWLGGG